MANNRLPKQPQVKNTFKVVDRQARDIDALHEMAAKLRSAEAEENVNPTPTPEETFYYLRRKTNERKPIEFRYKSARENSDKKWRTMPHFDFNREYFWDLDTQPSYKYRVDRVVEFKG